jgi:hypothetical protein
MKRVRRSNKMMPPVDKTREKNHSTGLQASVNILLVHPAVRKQLTQNMSVEGHSCRTMTNLNHTICVSCALGSWLRTTSRVCASSCGRPSRTGAALSALAQLLVHHSQEHKQHAAAHCGTACTPANSSRFSPRHTTNKSQQTVQAEQLTNVSNAALLQGNLAIIANMSYMLSTQRVAQCVLRGLCQQQAAPRNTGAL